MLPCYYATKEQRRSAVRTVYNRPPCTVALRCLPSYTVHCASLALRDTVPYNTTIAGSAQDLHTVFTAQIECFVAFKLASLSSQHSVSAQNSLSSNWNWNLCGGSTPSTSTCRCFHLMMSTHHPSYRWLRFLPSRLGCVA